jgi:hypothetical protein
VRAAASSCLFEVVPKRLTLSIINKMRLLLCFFTLLTTQAFAQNVKERLEHSLQTQYLQEVLTTHGPCTNQGECLLDQESHLSLQLADQSHCYPYTRCGFYHCMEEKFPCSSVGVNYFTGLAAPTCQSYVSNIQSERFSDEGVEWIYEVMVCLQKGLFEECGLEEQCQKPTLKESCDYIVDFTLGFHPGCYIESGVGVCQLSLKDQRMIWKTVGPYLTGREWIEAFKVIMNCFKPGVL